MKKLNIGNSDFKSIIQNNNYFVDKSLFIQEIIDGQNQVVLVPRPRRFGKTLNMSMLRYFFDINRPENKSLFENLKIWQTPTEITSKQGKFPVIYLSFKDAKAGTWTETFEYISTEIIKLYAANDYLNAGDFLKPYEKNVFNKILNKDATIVEYAYSLQALCEYLHRFYNQKVVILIDEYDTPIHAGYKKFYSEVVSFMRNFLSATFKDNTNLYKGVITGILRVSRESIFSGVNNISVCTMLDEEFSDKFGFTEEETRQMLKDFDVATDYDQIQNWYDGYTIGDKKGIYNPWSIINFISAINKGFKPYWVNTSSDDLLKAQINHRNSNHIREQIFQLINNQPIEKIIEENFVFNDLDKNQELLWTLLLFSGYLTVEKKLGTNRYLLKIPNFEIEFVFKNIVLLWLNTEVKIQQNLLIETAKHLTNNEIEKFEKGFKKIIGDTFSYFDIAGEAENVYQAYILGLFAVIGDDYLIKSNRESGEGRYDIMLIPHDKTKFGVVIEIKQVKVKNEISERQLQELVNTKIKEAKHQIEQNQYFKELIDNKVNNIIKLPIVFVGKTPYILPLQSEN
ncbi:MAG TPA: AAA family ATPase [Bacteroidales bacterium]|nr:AAA family ATPase [Bacteroidales bacterium]